MTYRLDRYIFEMFIVSMLEGHAQNFYLWWNDVIWMPGLQSEDPGQDAMPQCKWQMSDGPIDRLIGSIGQACLRSDKIFTDGEMMSFECQDCKERAWAGGYATIGQAVYGRTKILPMVKLRYFQS
jgi:hypothetical protein